MAKAPKNDLLGHLAAPPSPTQEQNGYEVLHAFLVAPTAEEETRQKPSGA